MATYSLLQLQKKPSLGEIPSSVVDKVSMDDEIPVPEDGEEEEMPVPDAEEDGEGDEDDLPVPDAEDSEDTPRPSENSRIAKACYIPPASVAAKTLLRPRALLGPSSLYLELRYSWPTFQQSTSGKRSVILCETYVSSLTIWSVLSPRL